MRVAIVNDLRLAVVALHQVVTTTPGLTVAWTAADGQQALERCRADRPDLILMDLIMPVMNGVEATRRIMEECPCAILVVTASVGKNVALVFEAMGGGALDAVKTPVLGPDGNLAGAEALRAKIATIRFIIEAGRPAVAPAAAPAPRPAGLSRLTPPLIAIGASTGGPRALSEIVRALPANCPAAIVIVQHINDEFAAGLAEWLDGFTPLPVRLARAGEAVRAGAVFVAASGGHLLLDRDLHFAYSQEPHDNPFRPSVDVFFSSLAAHWPGPALAVLLTGMGRDGAEGLLALRRHGWRTLAQDEATCTVYGMPKAAADIGAADTVLPLPRIASELLDYLPRE